MFIAGDLIAQNLIEKNKYDPIRTLRLAGYGTVIAGPSIVYWYRFLSSRVTLATPFKTLIARVSMDQLIFAPTFLFIFFAFNEVTQGHAIPQIKEKLVRVCNQ